MASLKNIMNTDDDQDDSQSVKDNIDSRSQQSRRLDSSASNPSYATSRNHATSTSTQSNGPRPSNRPSSPIAAEVSSSSSSSLTTSARRRSNASVDSMNSTYRTGSSSNGPMRPFASEHGSGESSVKLTPITRRVSKAKKGVAVHTCHKCDPPKTFTRAEHLRRHKLSHEPPELRCQVPGCDKVFHRKDLLERHQQRHEQDEKDTGEGTHPSTRRHSKGSSQADTSSFREPVLQRPVDFGVPGTNTSPKPAPNTGMGSSSWAANSNPSSSRNQMSSPQLHDPGEDYPMKNYVLGAPTPNIQTAAESFTPGFSEPRGMQGLALLQIPDTGATSLPWQDSSGMPSSASESTYSTPSDNTRRHQFPLGSSGTEWNAPPASYAAAPRDLHSPIMNIGGIPLPFTYSASPPPQLYQQVYPDGMGILQPTYPDDNSLYNPNNMPAITAGNIPQQISMDHSSSEALATVSAFSTNHTTNLPGCGHTGTEGFGMLAARDLMPVSLSRAARDSVPGYLEVYWDKVHPLYPIVHKPTFEDPSEISEQHSDVLRCAMAAVATQLLDEKEDRVKGGQLHAYAWYKSKVFTQSDKWPLPVKQTVLLCEYYARFRGKKKESYRPSSRFGPLYQRVFNSQSLLIPVATGRDGIRGWKTWIRTETRRRLLAACFVLDVHSACYHEQQHTSIPGLDYASPSTLPIPLSACTEQLWNAQNFQDWAQFPTTNNFVTLNDTPLELLTPSDMASVPPFDGAILLAASALCLPRRQSQIQADLVEDPSNFPMAATHMARLFPDSGVANTYLALHHTPLHFLLSVSGDSWVFNKKVIQQSSFTEHQKRLNHWRNSGSAAVATVFAARAMKAFLNIGGKNATSIQGSSLSRRDISDYWGVYVCALICWAFGHVGKRDSSARIPSRDASMQWTLAVANMEPAQLQNLSGRREAHGVVGLARAALAKDCLGGRNILFADAVGVLKKLEQGDNWKWF
ncbi:hypothetical protein G7046_g8691 [Stylonectria norvegica]|nr:hypothetical protein G7046_g8691 [Stylonectria norvegica]